MRETWRGRVLRWRFNLFPAYRGTGGRVKYIADDLSEVRVELPLSWRTRNYVGTIFGGSLYGATDPFYMIMLMHRLGRDYVVWDKAASIRFRKPGRSKLFATFNIDDDEVRAVKELAASGDPVDRVYTIDLVDKEGAVHAAIEKTIYIRKR
jgi:acyl-coenzyme A thioesterase PaaI-like protein